MVKDCPKCRLVNPPSAQRCDCGYDFVEKQVMESYLTEKDQAQLKENEQAKDSPWAFLRLISRFFRWFG